MNKLKTVMYSILLLLAGSLITTNNLYADEQTEQSVREALDQFHAALNAMFAGDLEPMKTVWSHTDDVTYMGPDGSFQVGWKDVLANWEAQAARKLGGQVNPENVHITVGQDIAIVQNIVKGENNNAESGQPHPVSLRATSTFRKENGQWKLIGLHTDLLPFLHQDSKANHIFQLINDRLAYMKDAALHKVRDNQPIEDKAREVVVINKAKESALAAGLDVESSTAFFEAQIAAAKAIQYRYQADWLFNDDALQQEPKDLVAEIRPNLIRIGQEITSVISDFLKTGNQFTPAHRQEFLTTVNVANLNQSEKEKLFESLRGIKLQ